jgi:parvulin-like peptidyl-prolyl isomerase
MTVRTRRPQRLGIRARLGGLVETEERQQALITVLFIGTIVAVALIFIGALGVGWYNDNIRALGKVGSVELSPQLLRDDIKLQQFRIARDQARVTQAQIAGQIDDTTAQGKLSQLDSEAQNLPTTALDTLVDKVYQSQLAPDNGITVADADIEARYQAEISDPEQRHVWVVEVEPQAADETTGPTHSESQAALDKANQALADLNAGKDFATVAQTYGTTDKSKAGGDLGSITQLAVADETFGQELFKLPANGTTGIIRGDDGTYRIGRVTEIIPGAADPSLKTKLTQGLTEDAARRLIGYELAAEGLKDKVVGDALAATPEQARIAVLYIEGAFTGDASAKDGEIDYSEIVFAPGDDIDAAPDLDPNDPKWAAAKTEADAALAQLQAITDPTERATKFAEMATDNSDDPTSSDGGAVGFTTRDLPPQEISDALWNGTFNKGDVLGPIKSDAGWYVIMFNEKRASPEDRVQQVKDALAQPNADFNALAKQYSDGPEKTDGGEIGWVTRDGLSTDIADKVFSLGVGQVSDPIELGGGHYFVKVEEKGVRPLDPDQQTTARQSAFDTWYTPKKTHAQEDGTITTIAPLGTDNSLVPGGDG